MATQHPASITRYLDVGFQGYFACRIATDPDPTNEERGMSGYTMALVGEDPLDQGIRLQVDEGYKERNYRAPMAEMGIDIGVDVISVTCDDEPWKTPGGLLGARVHLDSGEDPAVGLPLPIFESRNNITGSDDTMSFVINPFRLRIENGAAQLTAVDYVDPADPDRQLWQINDPTLYERRLTACWDTNDPEVGEAINVFDYYGYFRDRRLYLSKRIADNERKIAEGAPDADELRAANQAFRSRIYQLEFWGDRVISKIGTRCDWRFAINGPKEFGFDVGVSIDTDAPWPIEMWFGGWDGDFLIGYARGLLRLPFAES
jgi:hypothetical protein